ncbi:MAG TPA: hypothetical protein VHI13_09760 [Candidatus Kapabacteria bacterium]|nr:hypothetical protein [Candidatus Kapabacteria bacterium]
MKQLPMKPALSALLLFLSVAAAGCLSADHKEVILTVKPDGSGSGRVVFHDIVSMEEGGKDVSVADYTELISTYYKGRKFEDYYPQYSNFKKRLFEEDGKLSGEITFDFGNYEDAGLFRYKGQGPWMYHVGVKSEFAAERYDTSNGTLGGETMPVVFWPAETHEFRISSHYDRSDATVRRLLSLFTRIGTE